MIVGKLILETRDVGPEAKEFTVSRPPPSVAQWAVAFAAIVAAALLTDGLPNVVRAAITLVPVFWLLALARAVVSESLLYVSNVGVQTSTRRAFWPPSVRFVDRSRAIEIIINEGITCFTVRYYMAILIKDSMKMNVVFPNLLPPLSILTQVYQELQDVDSTGH